MSLITGYPFFFLLVILIIFVLVLLVLVFLVIVHHLTERLLELHRGLSPLEVADGLEVEVREALDKDVVREVRVLRDLRVEPREEREGDVVHLLDVVGSRVLPLDLEGDDDLLITILILTAAATTAALILAAPLLLLLAALFLLLLVDDLVLLDKLGVGEDGVLLELEDDLVAILGDDLKVSDVVEKLDVLLTQDVRDAVIVDLQKKIHKS